MSPDETIATLTTAQDHFVAAIQALSSIPIDNPEPHLANPAIQETLETLQDTTLALLLLTQQIKEHTR